MINRSLNLGEYAQKGNIPWNKGKGRCPTCITCGGKRSYSSTDRCRKCIPTRIKPKCLDCNIQLKTFYSKKCKSCMHKGRIGLKGSRSPSWKGESAKYTAKHMWIYSQLGKPEKCEFCSRDGLKGKFINWANKSGKYLRNLDDWIRLCKPCHVKFDDTINRGWVTRRQIQF